jgi:hypothetical protein
MYCLSFKVEGLLFLVQLYIHVRHLAHPMFGKIPSSSKQRAMEDEAKMLLKVVKHLWNSCVYMCKFT